MALSFIPVTGNTSTPSGGAGFNTFTDVASCTLSSDCSFIIDDIFLIGKGPSGETATAKAMHRGKRVSGTTSLVGSVVNIVTFTTGSDAAVGPSSTFQIIISGTNVILQVKSSAALNITWYGGFTIIKF